MDQHRQSAVHEDIDRLVDGELDSADRRRLLESFDAHPELWRDCAIAFLESQALRDVLTQAPDATSDEIGTVPAADVRTANQTAGLSKPESRSTAGSVVGLVCTVVVLCALSFLAGQWGETLRHSKTELPVAAIPEPGDEPTTAVVQDDAVVASDTVAQPADTQDHEVTPAFFPGVVGTVNLGLDGDATGSAPILVGPGIDEQFLLSQPGPLTSDALMRFHELGYRVNQTRQLMSVDLDGGARLAIPIDSVQVQYVGRPVD